jgi:hypothetical protein
VLHDQGVSRRHARIFTRGGRLYLTDLGSSAGTLCNGKALGKGKEQELHGGERLAIGPVEFVFGTLKPPPQEATRLVAPREVRPRSSTLITRAQTQQEMQAIEKEDTGSHRTVTDMELELEAPVPPPVPSAPSTLVEMEAPTLKQAPASRHPVRSSAAAGSALAAKAPSAAERARLRREQSRTLSGQLMLRWNELPAQQKSIAGVLAGLVIVAGLGAVLFTVFSGKVLGAPKGPEPTELTLTPLVDSFGLGEGVTWVRSDQKLFHFQFASPTRAVAVLHYQARDISQPKEVSLVLNGVELGWVPPDNQEVNERQLELILPLHLLRRDAPNQLTFDNVHNPPGEERWRVWNMYVEVIPVPELPTEQLLAKANKEAGAARQFYDQKSVGSENLFRSWKMYHSAWLTLEALDSKPELYEEVLYMLGQTASELDKTCRVLMLDFQRSLQFLDGNKAKATVQEALRRFPTTEHRCHNLILEKASEYDLPI